MKTIYWYLFVFLFIAEFSLSCSSSKEDDLIFEKVVKDFIVQYKENIDWVIKEDSVDNLIIYIRKKNTLWPEEAVVDTTIKCVTYPDLDLYSLYYNNYYIENEVSPPPSKLFYVDGYPVMLYDPNIPSMNSKDIPKALYKNDKRWGGDEEWLLGICKKTRKYIVIRDSYNKGDDTIKELNDFSCEDE